MKPPGSASSRCGRLGGLGGRTIAPQHSWRALLVLLLALAQTHTALGQMTLSSFTVGEKAAAAASDDLIGNDMPPDRDAVWTTNVFGLWQTNVANWASVGVAGASAAATNIGWVEPLSLGATGSVNVAAFSTSNRVDGASATARAWFDLSFTLPCTHEYRLETSLAGTPIFPFNYIRFYGGGGPDVLRTLPPDTSAATNSGRLAPGIYRLLADFAVSVNVSSGETTNNAAAYGLRLEMTPILPTLAIRQSGSDVVLAWTTNAAGFTLFHTADLPSTNWQATTWPTVIANDQYTVTEPVTDEQRFYRLATQP